jgi:protoheme IX farnesyltransferase
MRPYLELTKPRVTWLILMSTGIGFWAGKGTVWDLLVLLHTLVGTGLLASGTAVLNQWYERDTDAKMHRTQGRPLPTGRVAPFKALVFGVALSAAGFVELWLGANMLAALLGLTTLASYLFLYTPLKRVSPICTAVGAVPGAMPPLIGYAAASGMLDLRAWALYAILFLWQFPHFLAIARMYREDYARGGLTMLPPGESAARQILLSSLLLIPISLASGILASGGVLYLTGALVLGLAYFGFAVRASRDLTRLRARQLLLASVAYLPLLYTFMLLDK